MTAKAAPTHFTASDIEEVTGVPVAKQNQDIERGVVIPSRHDKRPTGSGDKRLSSIETVYQFALMAALLELNVTPRHAAYGARRFSDNPSPGC
jgi:hypothetical protein